MPPLAVWRGLARFTNCKLVMAVVSVGNAGLVLATVFAGWHLYWSILVAVGWAQAVIDFIFRMQFIKPVYVIEPLAAVLLSVTAAMGCVFAAGFAVIWNPMHKA